VLSQGGIYKDVCVYMKKGLLLSLIFSQTFETAL
jgi:hypothetical protein